MRSIIRGAAMLSLAITTAWAAENQGLQESMPKPAPKTKSNPRSQQPPATEKEKRDAFFAHFSSLDAAAREMDDGRSDASTIALGVKFLCATQFACTVGLQGGETRSGGTEAVREQSARQPTRNGHASRPRRTSRPPEDRTIRADGVFRYKAD
jgi:hypothetical protein